MKWVYSSPVDPNRVVSAEPGNFARQWDVDSSNMIKKMMAAECRSVVFSPDGRSMARGVPRSEGTPPS